MVRKYNRPKHLQAKNWFRVEFEGKVRVVRPVDGEIWFDEPGLSHGFVHMVDEDHERVGFCGVDWFDRNAKRVN